jgi:hypothetical protein
MWQKSLIQQQVELIQARVKFADDISKILESYTIDDGVFGLINNNTYELSRGYFIATKTFDNIYEATREMDQFNQAVRITNGKFILGNVYPTLNINEDFGDNKIFSIEYLDYIK